MTDRNTSETPPPPTRVTQLARDPFSPELIRRENRLEVQMFTFRLGSTLPTSAHVLDRQARERSTHT